MLEYFFSSNGWMIYALIGLVVLATVFIVWRIRRKNSTGEEVTPETKVKKASNRKAKFRRISSDIETVDGMEGHEFEYFCARLLTKNGFEDVQVTQGSGDQGVDILAEKDDIRYAIQCKNYASKLGNTCVQQIYAGKEFYHCHVGVVMTNSTFTQGAMDLAEATNVILWDRDKLQWLMDEAEA